MPLCQSELKEIFDTTSIEVLNHCMKKAVFSQPEIMEGGRTIPFMVPKETAEQWMVQAIGGRSVGSGNYAIDVVKENHFGADIKMVSVKVDKNGQVSNSLSGETSLAQNFKGTGNQLDKLFTEEKYDDILTGWKEIWFTKLQKPKEDYGLERIYYVFMIRAESKLYICAFEIDIDQIIHMTVEKGDKANVYIRGMISEKYGMGKIYRHKKRLELRLLLKALIEDGLAISLDLDFSSQIINLRELAETNQLSQYEHILFESIFQIPNSK